MQPFGQVPAFQDGDLILSGEIFNQQCSFLAWFSPKLLKEILQMSLLASW